MIPHLPFPVRRPKLVIAVALLASVAAFWSASSLVFDNDVDRWLLGDDPGLVAYDDFKREFGSDEHMVIGYKTPDGILGPENIRISKQLTGELRAIEGVVDVSNITTAEEIRSSGDEIRVTELITEHADAAERRRVLDKLSHDPLYRRSVASPDGSVATIIVRVKALEDHADFIRRRAILTEVRDVLAGVPQIHFHLTGGAAFDTSIFEAMVDDQTQMLPIMGIVFVVVLGVLFRSSLGIFVPTLTVAASVLWTFGLMGTTDYVLSIVSTMLPVVLLAVGVADSVHLISEYQEMLGERESKLEALADAMRTVFRPCLFTSATTALGFLGLMVIRVSPLREFGLFASIGTMMAFVATFTVVPAALALGSAPRAIRHSVGQSPRLMGRVFRFVAARPRQIALAALAGALFGLAGLPWVTTSANNYGYLRNSHPVIQATDFVEEHVGGVYTIEVLTKPSEVDSAEAMKNPAALKALDQLGVAIAKDPAIEHVVSASEFVKAMNSALNEEGPGFRFIPDERNTVGQLLLMYELDAPDGDLYDFLNFDMNHARLTARARMSQADDHPRLLASIRELASSQTEIEATVTGVMALYNRVEQYMLRGMMLGFAVAFVSVAIMMTFLLGNLRYGMLAMIPAALPILFVVGMTGWTSTPLGTMSAMMGNVALGIAVDNAIHMLSRYRLLRADAVPARTAIEEATTIVGRPVLFTTLVLCLGFSVLVFSELRPNRMFGGLTALILAGSLLGSIITLPATVLLFDSITSRRNHESESDPVATDSSLAGDS